MAQPENAQRSADVTRGRYAEWKGWRAEEFMVCSEAQRHYLDAEFASTPLKGKSVLEIGFGNGAVLKYMQERGASVAGTEVEPSLIERARSVNLRTYAPDLSDAIASGATFDLVIAFDVFEHLTVDELRSLLTSIARTTSPGALLVTRFPNGQSPLGRVYQYGDLTHRTVLSAGMLPQLLEEIPFLLEDAAAPRTSLRGPITRRLLQLARLASRKTLERTINLMYGTRTILDPNVVVRLRRLGGA